MSYKAYRKSAQECPTKVSEKNVSYKSVKIVWAFVFEHAFAFGFVGSILLLKLSFFDESKRPKEKPTRTRKAN